MWFKVFIPKTVNETIINIIKITNTIKMYMRLKLINHPTTSQSHQQNSTTLFTFT